MPVMLTKNSQTFNGQNYSKLDKDFSKAGSMIFS